MKKFESSATLPGNGKWAKAVERRDTLYSKEGEIRSAFNRDYNRLLHCKAYRRLKHKTQVFYATGNDHVCTRMEHVGHVAAVSYSIAAYLGLNHELTSAIALGHDIGHAPFGHEGENVLRGIAKEENLGRFWHEKNSLFFADCLETLPDLHGKEKNLDLTYAVRDGLISHCGEVNENAIYPRENTIDLEIISKPSEYQPYTWEGCVVKIADKISYLGRDIEDALTLKILDQEQMEELACIAASIKKVKVNRINNTVLMHDFIRNLCKMSSPEKGILFSEKYLHLINSVKEFNYKNIYKHRRLKYYNDYAALVLRSLYDALASCRASGQDLGKKLLDNARIYGDLFGAFHYWMMKYSDMNPAERKKTKFGNRIIYQTEDPQSYNLAVIHYISSMTDHFAVKLFGELTRF